MLLYTNEYLLIGDKLTDSDLYVCLSKFKPLFYGYSHICCS